MVFLGRFNTPIEGFLALGAIVTTGYVFYRLFLHLPKNIPGEAFHQKDIISKGSTLPDNLVITKITTKQQLHSRNKMNGHAITPDIPKYMCTLSNGQVIPIVSRVKPQVGAKLSEIH